MAWSAHDAGPVAVIGAGRWARELARTVCERAPAARLIMHSAAHGSGLRDWLTQQPALAATRVTESLAELAGCAPAAVIIANAARDHARAIDWALDGRVAALVEKPFTDSLGETRRLVERAATTGGRLYAAHVLMFANYLPEFARRVAGLPPPRAIAVEWCDPRQEVRHGVSKRFDAGVPVYLDCLPHVVSVLETVWPGRALQLADVGYARGGARVVLGLRVGGIPCEVLLERHAAQRRRCVRLTGEHDVTLDFSVEPGEVTVDGTTVGADPEWPARPRPMAALIDAFLDVVRGAPMEPRLDAGVALRAAELIAEVAPVYNSRRLQWLGAALSRTDRDDDDLEYALAEVLQARRPLDADALAAHARQVRRQFGSGGHTGGLDALLAAEDPVSMLEVTAA